MPETPVLLESIERYRQNNSKAVVTDLLGKITGANTDLVSYDEVANRIKSRQRIEMGTQNVPLEQIVGSVGRYRDFTRTFLPRSAVNPERWARIDAILHSMAGYLPIDLYKIGEVYFVRDGNHRVSVARANGLSHIEAYVTEIPTTVDLTLDDFERDQWIIKIERSNFLMETELDQIRPENDVALTEPGRYPILLRHIKVHHYFRNMDLERAGDGQQLTWSEAVASWFDNIYLPVVEAIRRHDTLVSFPARTEADLYLWIAFHREQLAKQYGLAPLTPDAAVTSFEQTHSERPLEQAMQSLKAGFLWAFGDSEKPPGLTEEEFVDARARHAAGERTLAEAEAEQPVYDDPEADRVMTQDGEFTDFPLELDPIESEELSGILN